MRYVYVVRIDGYDEYGIEGIFETLESVIAKYSTGAWTISEWENSMRNTPVEWSNERWQLNPNDSFRRLTARKIEVKP